MFSDNGNHRLLTNELVKLKVILFNPKIEELNIKNGIKMELYIYFGEPLDTELEPQTKGYIYKEKDKENNIGDHGVRKHDSQKGRFTSTEPLYEKYFGWAPYQYCGNKIKFCIKHQFIK